MKKKLQVICMGFILLMVLSIFPKMTVKADEYYADKLRNFKNVVYMPRGSEKKEGIWFNLEGMPENCTNYKVSVSNKKILKTKIYQDTGLLLLFPKKTGTVKIKVTAYSNGRKVTSYGKIKFVKWKNPFKTFTIGGKNCKKSVSGELNLDSKAISGKNAVKIKYKLNSGWKAISKHVSYSYDNGGTKAVKLKNKKSYPLPYDGEMQVWFTLKNKKNGARVYVGIDVYRSTSGTYVTQYRYSNKLTTTNTASKLSGWILYNTTSSWSSWGNWSGWSTTAQTANDYKQVETRKEYRYYCYLCPVCGGREPLKGNSDCKKYSLNDSNWRETWSTVPYANSNSSTYSYATYKRYTSSLGDGLRWNFSSGNLYSTAVGTKDSDSSATVIRNAYRYRTRTKNTIYHYYKWGNWSAWSNVKYVPNANRKVETRRVWVPR